MAQPTDRDPSNPHDLAVDIHTDLQKLAVMLAHAGASPQAVSQLTKMSEIIAQVVKVLGNGPPIGSEQAGPQQPGPAGPPQAGPPQAAPAGPPQAGPPQAPAPPAQPTPLHHALHAAAHATAMAMQQSAAQRR